MQTKKRITDREVDRTPLDEEGKKRIAVVKEYYRKCAEAEAKGEPPPPLPRGWTRSPLDKPAGMK
jgi:hypothetical protein